MAYIEREMGWKATYYFRAVPESFDESIILQIASLGHEIGYHYESLATCHGNMEAAYSDFCRNLERFRSLVPVTTIAMHGSVRDKIPTYQETWEKRGWAYHSTDDIIHAIRQNTFPERVMLNVHPQRWTDNRLQWLKEISTQSVKNILKRLLVRNYL